MVIQIVVLDMLITDQTLINIIISSLIAVIIALFVRYGIKPKIEKIYETNRNVLIGRLLTSVFIVSNQFNNAFDIFERQPNFDPSGQISYNLTTNEIVFAIKPKISSYS